MAELEGSGPVNTLEMRIERLKAGGGRSQPDVTDRSPWDWYAESCPCGLPAGECRVHPRARPTQRPPAGDWRVWAYVAGRGAGKTRAGACWIQQRVENGTMKLGCLIAPTANDIRDVMVEGPSGLLAVAPPWCRPRFEPSKRRVTWPNGACAVCLSGEEPERARGSERRHALGRRAGLLAASRIDVGPGDAGAAGRTNPQAMITTTPRRVAVLKRILVEPTTVQTTDTTYANQAHLPREFLAQIVRLV